MNNSENDFPKSACNQWGYLKRTPRYLNDENADADDDDEAFFVSFGSNSAKLIGFFRFEAK